MSRYIDVDALLEHLQSKLKLDYEMGLYNHGALTESFVRFVERQPTADVVEVRHGYNVGDFCLYGFVDGNKSLAIVEIVKILDDERGIAEVKFHKVIKDNTGNGFFHYLFKSGKTMNASFEYLKNITPKVGGERREE